MAVVTELELPELDFFAPDLRGERFHEEMGRLSAAGWLATSAIGYFVLDREAAAFFLRTRAATFPGMKIAEMFEVPEGPLLEQMRRNILHLGGDDPRRLRNLVNPAFTPRAADRWRPAMRDFLERLWEPLAEVGRCEFVGAFAKPYPSLTTAEQEGDRLSDVECMNLVLNVLVGGVDTTQSQLAHAVRLFAAHPGQWRPPPGAPGPGPPAGGGGGGHQAATP